jgi:hypothetical protein
MDTVPSKRDALIIRGGNAASGLYHFPRGPANRIVAQWGEAPARWFLENSDDSYEKVCPKKVSSKKTCHHFHADFAVNYASS